MFPRNIKENKITSLLRKNTQKNKTKKTTKQTRLKLDSIFSSIMSNLTSITLIFFWCSCIFCFAVNVTWSRPSLLFGDNLYLVCFGSFVVGDDRPCFPAIGLGLEKCHMKVIVSYIVTVCHTVYSNNKYTWTLNPWITAIKTIQ